MGRLSLTMLGTLQVKLDEKPVPGLSPQVRALLAYLALEADCPQRREELAALLWPEQTDQNALRKLRYTLSDLRQALCDHLASPPVLLVTRETIQFNPESDHWLDVAAFRALAGARSPGVSDLQQAVALYRGDLLDGLYSKSTAFEEWLALKREQLYRQALSVLHRLAELHEERGECAQAQECARRRLEMDPWQERAYQQLMRVLALDGRRSEALAQYETCRRVLKQEFGIEPARETTVLYESIRDGDLKTAPPPLPGPLPRVPFVARERELTQLEAHLEQALAGQAHVVFVTGEAGSGKTALLHEFVRRAMESHGHLVAANGSCNAYTGLGVPYLPFLEIMQMLAGDVESQRAGGAITPEHSRCL